MDSSAGRVAVAMSAVHIPGFVDSADLGSPPLMFAIFLEDEFRIQAPSEESEEDKTCLSRD